MPIFILAFAKLVKYYMMSQFMQQISIAEVQNKLSNGAILVDIREPKETAAEYIESAEKWPLSVMPNQKPDIKRKKELIFFCRSGARTQMNAKKLDASFPNTSYIMQGGIGAWRGAKLPVIADKSAIGAGINFNYVILAGFVLFISYQLIK